MRSSNLPRFEAIEPLRRRSHRPSVIWDEGRLGEYARLSISCTVCMWLAVLWKCSFSWFTANNYSSAVGAEKLKKKKKWGEVNIHLYFLQVFSEISFTFNSLILQEFIFVKNMDFTPQTVNSLSTISPQLIWNQRPNSYKGLGSVSELFNSVLTLHSKDQSFIMCFYYLQFFNGKIFLLIFISHPS